MPDLVARQLHHVDQRCSGEVAMPDVVTADAQARRHYLVNSLMEEAIRSSQLEGATTTRRVAKEMLRTGRDPQDRSERMILNNFRALQYMRDSMGDELTPAAVLELQRILTEDTLDNPNAAGRLQRPDEVRVADERDATYFIVYQLEVIEQAISRFHSYLKKKIQDVREVERLLRGSGQFNHRQLAALGSAIRDPDVSYTFRSHAARHDVTHETARSDLIPLVELGFLRQGRTGRGYTFTPPVDLPSRLKTAG